MLLYPQLTIIVDTVKGIPRIDNPHVQRLIVGQKAKDFRPEHVVSGFGEKEKWIADPLSDYDSSAQ